MWNFEIKILNAWADERAALEKTKLVSPKMTTVSPKQQLRRSIDEQVQKLPDVQIRPENILLYPRLYDDIRILEPKFDDIMRGLNSLNKAFQRLKDGKWYSHIVWGISQPISSEAGIALAFANMISLISDVKELKGKYKKFIIWDIMNYVLKSIDEIIFMPWLKQMFLTELKKIKVNKWPMKVSIPWDYFDVHLRAEYIDSAIWYVTQNWIQISSNSSNL